jgi:hypothetical protein
MMWRGIHPHVLLALAVTLAGCGTDKSAPSALDAGSDAMSTPAKDSGLSHDAAGASDAAAESSTDTGSTAVFPLRASTNHRYLVSPNGKPYLLVGDAPHDLFTNVSIADATSYLEDRAAHGFNALWCELLVGSAIGGRADDSTYDGIVPFTGKLSGGQYDLTTPNPAYFARVDQVVELAASYGMLVFLDTFDWDSQLDLYEANGNAGAASWGKYVGTRYASFPNILWITGNDIESWNTSATDNALLENIMGSIATADPNRLQTTELNYNISGSLDDALLVPYTTLAAAYTYYPTYFEVLQEYNSKAATVPVFLEETYYEGGSYGSLTPTTATDLMLRKAAYWTVLSGGLAGYMSGTNWYDFHEGWHTGIDATSETQIGYWKSLFTSVAWYELAPDQTQSVTTAGYGTPSGGLVGPCGGTGETCGSGDMETDDYVTTAITSDGSLAMAYCPVSTTLTVDLGKLRSMVTARWYDPTTATSAAVSGSPFPNTGSQTFTTPGNNGEGDPDWVLVLEAP